jgi:hypothetical protein
VWSQVLAYAFATHFLLGTLALVNAAQLSFFLYFPRRIEIALIGSQIDPMVWAGSIFGISIILLWFVRREKSRITKTALSILGLVLSILSVAGPRSGDFGTLLTLCLFVVGSAEFIALRRWPVFSQKLPNVPLSRVLVYLVAYLAMVEIASATNYVMRAFDITTTIGRTDANIELQLSYLPYPLLPWLYVGFLFSWAWVPFTRRVWQHLRPKNLFRLETGEEASLLTRASSAKLTSLLSDPRFFMVLAVAVFVGFYPYFHNPPWLVGTDAYWRYYDPLRLVDAKGIPGGFIQALDEWHPAALSIMYIVQLAFRMQPFAVVQQAPLIIVITLGLSSWWFLARKRTTEFGLIIFLLSVLSIATTVGFYASILANWIALLIWVVFFAYVGHRSDSKLRSYDIIVLSLLSLSILIIHAWTWGVFATSVLVAAILGLFQERRKALRVSIVLVLAILIDLAAAFLILTLLGPNRSQGVANALQIYTSWLSNPSSLLFFWGALTRLTTVWAAFFSPLSILISIFGVFVIWSRGLTTWRRRLLLAWILVSSVGSILVAPFGYDPLNPTGSESQLWRLLFLTPLQMTVPFGVVWLAELPRRLRLTKNGGPASSNNTSATLWIGSLFLVGVLLAFAPGWWRFLLIFVVLPFTTAFALLRAGENDIGFLRLVILVSLVLVCFNNTTRALSQLLFDPHNYRPGT